MDNRVLGRIGENAAADVLRAQGCRIRKQNYRCSHGEIDIIAEKNNEWMFVEVKTRQNFKFGRPCEVINREKKQHIRRTAHAYMDEMGRQGQRPGSYSFHIMEVVVEHTEYAF